MQDSGARRCHYRRSGEGTAGKKGGEDRGLIGESILEVERRGRGPEEVDR